MSGGIPFSLNTSSAGDLSSKLQNSVGLNGMGSGMVVNFGSGGVNGLPTWVVYLAFGAGLWWLLKRR